MNNMKEKVVIAVVGGVHGHLDFMMDHLLPLLRASECMWEPAKASGNWSGSAHNAIVDAVLHHPSPPDRLLLLDADMAFPSTALNTLLQRNADVVGPTYRRKSPKLNFPLIEYPLSSLFTPSIRDPANRGIHAWDAIPAGMMLIKLEVLLALAYPWFFDTPGKKLEDFVTTDMNFCRSARKAGFGVFCDYDLSREVAHLADGVPIPFDLD